MAAPSVTSIDQVVVKPPVTTKLSSNPIVSYVSDAYNSLAERRAALQLPNPGSVENINKEVSRDTFLTNYAFSGLRADLTKMFSVNPIFQMTHSLAVGSPNGSPYVFGAFFATDNVFMQGNLDSDASLSGRLHYRVGKNFITKANAQISRGQPAMVQLENDYQGSDFNINIKALNPSILENGFTGVVVGSFLQSVTPHLALGLETMWSRQTVQVPPDAATSYVLRYSTPEWIASGQLHAQGVLQTSFWRKVTDKVDAGVEMQLSAAGGLRGGGGGGGAGLLGGGMPTPEGISTIGARYEFRQSVFRGQLDTLGKVSCLLEHRIIPNVAVLFSGEIDHFKNTAKVGIGLQMEAGGEEVPFEGVDPTTIPQVRPPV